MEEIKKNKKCECSTQSKQLEELKNKWEECARFYAEKFRLAYKGFLMTKGLNESRAQAESEKVLDKIRSCED